jgi:tripartite-type tricarboxylate transporter receptor subunit TctC
MNSQQPLLLETTMQKPRRQIILTGLMAAALGAAPAVMAQDYPSKTITIVVPFSAGGGVDTVARLLAEKLRVTLKQNVIVDNKAGGSGMIGALAVVKASPDGHTLLLGSAGETAINSFVYKSKMQYQPSKDLAPVTLVTRIPNVLVAAPNFPVKNVEELVTYAKKNPGKVSYSSSGVGNPQRLNGELLEELVSYAKKKAGWHSHGACALQRCFGATGRCGLGQCGVDLRELCSSKGVHQGREGQGIGRDIGQTRSF